MTALEAIKSIDNRHALLLFMRDEKAKKFLVGWTLYKPKCTDRPLVPGQTLDQSLSELWSELPLIDFYRLSQIAGLSLGHVIELFERLKDAQIIYPDGTITQSARTLIASEVGSYVAELTKNIAGSSKRPLASEKTSPPPKKKKSAVKPVKRSR